MKAKQQSGKTKSSPNPSGTRWVSKIKPSIIPLQMKKLPRKEENIKPVWNRGELHPRNWKQFSYHKMKQRVLFRHLNLKRKRKLSSSNYNVTMLPTIIRKVEVEIFVCNKVNLSQGLIYIYEYNISDIEDYDNELKKEFNLLDVKKATWIKKIASTPLLLT